VYKSLNIVMAFIEIGMKIGCIYNN